MFKQYILHRMCDECSNVLEIPVFKVYEDSEHLEFNHASECFECGHLNIVKDFVDDALLRVPAEIDHASVIPGEGISINDPINVKLTKLQRTLEEIHEQIVPLMRKMSYVESKNAWLDDPEINRMFLASSALLKSYNNLYVEWKEKKGKKNGKEDNKKESK